MSGFLMIAKREEKDNFQIWQVAYSNGEARRITSDSFDHHDFRLTADDRCLITVQVERNNTISIIDDRVTSDLQSHEIMKGYSRNDGENGLAWSPDGKLVYAAKVDGNGDIWSMNADGSDRKRLTSAADLDVQPVVTRDGRSIVYVSRTNGRRNIWRMDIDGAHQTQLTAGNSELEPTITPDAKVVLFTNGDFGKRLLYSVSIDGGSANRLSEKNIRGPAAVSPDGRLVAVFFLDEKSEPKRWKILIMYFDGREMKVLDPSPPVNSNSSLKWTADGSGLTYSVSNEGQSSIYFLPIEGGPPRQVSNPAIGAITWFDWSPDGQRLAIARLTESSDAVLLRNFR
jgi:TolB protein